MAILAQILGNVKKESVRPDWFGQCWVWQGECRKDGYAKWKRKYAYRAVYEILVSKIQPGQVILHLCDNPSCVNPEHLKAGTKDDNAKDAASKWRMRKGSLRKNAKLGEAAVEEIRRRVAAGERQDHIAKEFGVPKQRINRVVLGDIWQHAEGPTTRLRRSWSKLTRDQISHIAKLKNTGLTQKQVGKITGYTQQTISRALKRHAKLTA